MSTEPTDVVIVDAVRTPIGKRGGGLSTMHSADLLAAVQRAAVDQTGIDAEVGQVVGGCVSQVGAAGLQRRPHRLAHRRPPRRRGGHHRRHPVRLVPAGHQPGHRPRGVGRRRRRRRLRRRGHEPRPDGRLHGRGTSARPIPRSYFPQYEWTSQFEGAERIADKWGITRDDADAFGLRVPAARGPGLGRGPLRHPDRAHRRPRPRRRRQAHRHHPPGRARRGPPRDHPRRRWPGSSRSLGEDGVHTAGSSSQISDGAAAVLLMTAAKAEALGLTPRARIVDTCLVGTDPVLMLTGPIDATQQLLRTHRHDDGRHRRRRDQRGLRLGRARLGQGVRARHGHGQPQRRRHRASATRSAAPAPSC